MCKGRPVSSTEKREEKSVISMIYIHMQCRPNFLLKNDKFGHASQAHSLLPSVGKNKTKQKIKTDKSKDGDNLEDVLILK